MLSKVPARHAWFSVNDLKDVFWACSLEEESRNWFAFEWKDENTGSKQLHWTHVEALEAPTWEDSPLEEECSLMQESSPLSSLPGAHTS